MEGKRDVKNNPMVPILQAAKNKTIAAKGLEMAEKINADMRELTAIGRPLPYREKAFQQHRTEMAKIVFDQVEVESDRLKAVIDKDRKAWEEAAENHVHARADRLAIAQARYAAMSDVEIRAELDALATADFITGDPVVVDALIGRARQSGLDQAEIEAYRETVVKKDYDKPWLQSPEARQAEKEIKLYSSQGREPYKIPVVGPGGDTTAIPFEDLLDGSDYQETEGAYSD